MHDRGRHEATLHRRTFMRLTTTAIGPGTPLLLSACVPAAPWASASCTSRFGARSSRRSCGRPTAGALDDHMHTKVFEELALAA
jgi:hypothetical protein